MRSVVADAGPLIGLARIGRLNLLRKLFGTIAIPPHVFHELKLSKEVKSVLNDLTKAGYHISLSLSKRIIELAGD